MKLYGVMIPPGTKIPNTEIELGAKGCIGLPAIHPVTKKAVLQLQNITEEGMLRICKVYAPLYGGEVVQLVPIPLDETLGVRDLSDEQRQELATRMKTLMQDIALTGKPGLVAVPNPVDNGVISPVADYETVKKPVENEASEPCPE